MTDEEIKENDGKFKNILDDFNNCADEAVTISTIVYLECSKDYMLTKDCYRQMFRYKNLKQ